MSKEIQSSSYQPRYCISQAVACANSKSYLPRLKQIFLFRFIARYYPNTGKFLPFNVVALILIVVLRSADMVENFYDTATL